MQDLHETWYISDFLLPEKVSMLAILFRVAELCEKGVSNELGICLFVWTLPKFSTIKILSEPVLEKLVCLWKLLCVQSVVEALHT